MSCRRFCITLSALVACMILGTAAAWASYIGNVTFSHDSPSHLDHDTLVAVSADYKIDSPGGAQVYFSPYTLGAPTPNYEYGGSPLYPSGTGVANGWFRIQAGEQDVTHVCVYMYDPDASEVLLKILIPVQYHYGPHGAFNIQTGHSENSRLPHGHDLFIDFDYAADTVDGCKIFARPFTNGTLTPGYSASGSPDLPPSGSATQRFSFDADADVTDIRFQIVALDNTLLHEFFVPFEVYWREVGVYDVSFDWPDGHALHNSQQLTTSFTFEHDDPGGLKVWTWCMTDGIVTPGGTYQPSALEPAGASAVTRQCRVVGGEQFVDAIHFRIRDADNVLIDEFDVPVDYHWGPHAVQNPAGEHAFTFRGDGLSSGAYICRLETIEGVQTQRLTLVK